MKTTLCLLTLLCPLSLHLCAQTQAGPYAPAAGEDGSTAILYNSPLFRAWATGWRDYLALGAVAETWKKPNDALGPAGNDNFHVVSLGAGGSITLTFDRPITNGPGYDFAVFENANIAGFLELAYVEVSTDGQAFYRFPSDYTGTEPIGPFENVVDPTHIDGLAGKYLLGYGVPFDLQQLAGIAAEAADLDLNLINYIRIVDVLGDGSNLDSSGDPIYDPYPTFGSVGFDLDAVGVLNEFVELSFLEITFKSLSPALVIGWQGNSTTTYHLQGSSDLKVWSTIATQVGVDGENNYTISLDSNPFFIRVGQPVE